MDTEGEVKTDDAAASAPAEPVIDAQPGDAAPAQPAGEPLSEGGDPDQESEPAPAAAPEPGTTESSERPQAADTDLFAQVSAEAESEIAAEEAALTADHASPDDELDPELLDIFRDARNEVQETTLASELEDVTAQEVLNDATAISQRLGVPPRGLARAASSEADESSGASEDHEEAEGKADGDVEGKADEEADVEEPEASAPIER